MKKLKGCIIVWMIGMCFLWIKPVSVHGETEAGQIVMSIEKATIGQGYIMEPQYVSYYAGESIAQVTLRELQKLGRTYHYDGRVESGFYLSEISDPNRGATDIPDYIIESINAGNGITLYDDYTPDYLGEFDYSQQSGWMYSVNGNFPRLSACDVTPRDGQVVRWQFTLVGLGKDLYGDPKISDTNILDREDLCYTLASVRKKKELLSNGEVKAAYDRCLKLGVRLTTAKADIQDDLNTLKKALEWNVLTDVTFYNAADTGCAVKYGTPQENLKLPALLRAVKGGTQSIFLSDISWVCREGYTPDKAGTYTFYPIIPKQYIVLDGVTLPAYQVQVRKLGDVNGDGNADEEDVNALVPFLGREVEQDEQEAVYDLNLDGVINLRDYSLLLGAVNEADIRSEDDSRIQLKLEKGSYQPGDTVTASIMVYSTKLDTAAMQLIYDPAKITEISVSGQQEFRAEQMTENDRGCFLLLGRRSGMLSTTSINGICIGRITFKYFGEGVPELTFGAGTSSLLEGNEAIGYRNGQPVSFETDLDYGDNLRMICQLNEGRIRNAEFTGETVAENGIEMQVVNIVFQYTDAEAVPENYLRVKLQTEGAYSFAIGGGCEGGEITEPFREEDGIYYAEGEYGCLRGGRSPQKETGILYGKLENSSGRTYYKIFLQRKGYAAVEYKYTDKEPFLLSGWNPENPDVLTARWSVEDADLKEWDSEGNPVEGLRVVMPGTDTEQNLYTDASESVIYARKPGNYWLDVVDHAGETKGRIRIVAEYPYAAAEYFIQQAEKISLNEEDYHTSAGSKIRKYISAIANVKEIQQLFRENVKVYLDENSRYTAQDTGTAVVDSYGYMITSDYLRTTAVTGLLSTMEELGPELEENRLRSITAEVNTGQVTYNGMPQKPQITVRDENGTAVPASGYKAEYKNNINAGTARIIVSGTGYYKGTQTLSFVIQKARQKLTVKSSGYTKQVGDKAFSLGAVSSGDGKISYASSNTSVLRVSAGGAATPVKKGTAYITVKAGESGNYLASQEVKIKVTVLAVPSLKVAKTSWKKTYGSKPFSLGAKTSKGASITYKTSDKKVVTVSAKGAVTVKGPGQAVITVSSTAKGQGTAVKTVRITIVPKKLAAPALKSKKSKQLTVTWKKDTKVTGYEVEAAPNKKFKTGVIRTTIAKYKTTSATLKKLTGGKTYYVRVRSFKKSAGGIVYSNWSTVKSIKIKK